MRYLKTLLIVLLAATQTAVAENADSDEKESKVRISVTGELNNADAWRVDAGCHWFPIPYVGIGGSIGMWSQYSANGIPNGNNWSVDDKSSKPRNLYAKPSVVLLSPDVIKGEGWGLRLYGEAGVMFNVPYERVDICKGPYGVIPYEYDYVSSNKGDWCFFDGKIGLSMRFDRVSITAGYAYSTLDVYAQRRKMTYDNQNFASFYPKRKATQGAFLSLSVNL